MAQHPPYPQASGDHVHTVASHYNQLEEAGLQQRAQSRIYYLRNFNNWIKSVLIGEALEKLRETDQNKEINVLDLCSGKGGDLLKWAKGRIKSLVCADIAATSVEQCETRYHDSARRGRGHKYSAEFIVADCTKVRLREMYKNPHHLFQLVSCQFSFHYSFESYPQAQTMLRNAVESIELGGFFIGTTPNSNEIVHRLRMTEGNSFGNKVYRISFPTDEKINFPLFGAKYDFHLEGVVDCPEFLVYFPALEKMAADLGLKLVFKKSFSEYFHEKMKRKDHFHLLSNMQALEMYPPRQGVKPVSSYQGDYAKADEFLEELNRSKLTSFSVDSCNAGLSIGTLTQAEWDAATIYLVFCFQKVCDGPLVQEDCQHRPVSQPDPSPLPSQPS